MNGKMILQKSNICLMTEGAEKTLNADGHILRWRTLSEYSFQIGIDGQTRMVEAGDPVSDTVVDGCWIRRYEHTEMQVEITCILDDGVMLKTISVTAKQPFTLRYARTEIAAVAEELTRGGEGQPLFVGNTGFIADTFPVAENDMDGALLFLRHAPFAALHAGEKFAFCPVVFGVDTGAGVEESFRRFILQRRPHPNGSLRVYCDWGAHDECADNRKYQLNEEMARRIVQDLKKAKEKTGVTYDYYIMDNFWYTPDSYDSFDERHWPEGPDRFLKELKDLGMEFGLWFDVNLRMVLLPDKSFLRSNTADELCIGLESNMDRLFSAVEKHVREHGVRMLKFDFAIFDCDNPDHDFHSQRHTASKEPAVRDFIARLGAIRAEHPDLQVLAYNGFTTRMDFIASVDPNRTGWAISPFWAIYVDYVYCGDPRPAERPAPLEKSVVHYSDCMMEKFIESLIPREAIDDHGTMIGLTNTIYYLQKRSLRDSYIMNIVRGTRKIHLYGETGLLDDADWKFLAEAQKLFDFVCREDCRTEAILDRPSRGTVYGYANTCGDRGIVTAVNVTAAKQQIAVDIPGRLKWKRIYHAGEWCDEPLTMTGGLIGVLEEFGIDVFEWERIGESEDAAPARTAIATQTLCGYVEADTGTEVDIELPAGCKRIGVRFLADNLSPMRAQNKERENLRISAEGGELRRLDDTVIWSGISFAIYEVRAYGETVHLRFKNTGKEQLILHWQDMTSVDDR